MLFNLLLAPFLIGRVLRHRLAGIVPVHGIIRIIFHRSAPVVWMHRWVVYTRLGIFQFKMLTVQRPAHRTGPGIQSSDIFVFLYAGCLVRRFVRLPVEVGSFCADQAFSRFVGLPHPGR